MQASGATPSGFSRTPVLTRIPIAPAPTTNPDVILKELEMEAVALANLHKKIFDQVRRLAVCPFKHFISYHKCVCKHLYSYKQGGRTCSITQSG